MRSPAPPAWFNFAAQVNEEGKTFKGETVLLGDDIDLNNEPWTPIGQTGSTEFKGVFDGQGYTIKNLYIDSTAETGAHYSSGLFGWLENHGDGIVIRTAMSPMLRSFAPTPMRTPAAIAPAPTSTRLSSAA